MKYNPRSTGNKLYKVAAVIDHIKQNCNKTEPEQYQSINEQIVPAKSGFSGIRQYNPKKPTKWDFERFVRSGSSGIMHDFFFYTGATGNEKCNDLYVVKRLVERMGILYTATIRKDRMKVCELTSENEMKKMGRGTHRYKCDLNSGLVIVRWYDNECVNVCSNYANPEPFSPVKRWDRVNKKHRNINCRDVIKDQNKSMGGVDIADMLISRFRTTVKRKRWYLKNILFDCVDISKVNAWLLYRRHCNQPQVLQRKQLSLLTFISKIVEGLGSADKVPRGVGRPSKRKSTDDVPAAK